MTVWYIKKRPPVIVLSIPVCSLGYQTNQNVELSIKDARKLLVEIAKALGESERE